MTEGEKNGYLGPEGWIELQTITSFLPLNISNFPYIHMAAYG